MAAGNFEACLRFVLAYEGGKVDDPRDPGGRTSQGVTQRTFNSYCNRKKLPHKDVYQMTEAERDAIYKYHYWDKIKGDALRKGEDLVVFDFAVNSGVARALRLLDDCGGLSCGDMIDSFCGHRLTFLQGLKHWPVFGKGWSRRVSACEKLARSMMPTPEEIKEA